MKVKITADQFKQAVQFAGMPVSNRTTLPILAMLKIETINDQLKFTGTDLDIYCQSLAECEIKEAGSIVLSNRQAKILAELDSALTIETVGNKVNIETETETKQVFEYLAISADEFPRLGNFETKSTCGVDGDYFGEVLKFVTPIMSVDESRYVLNGVYFNSNKEGFRMVATDGRQLVVNGLNTNQEGDGILMPAKAVQILLKSHEEKSLGVVTVNTFKGSDNFEVIAGRRRMVSKIIEGNYPNFQQVIPATPISKVKIVSGLIRDALEFMTVIESEKYSGFEFSLTKEVFIFRREVGDEKLVQMLEVLYDGPPIKMFFNVKFFLRALKCYPGEVTMTFHGELNPVVFSDGKTTNVLMPIRMP